MVQTPLTSIPLSKGSSQYFLDSPPSIELDERNPTQRRPESVSACCYCSSYFCTQFQGSSTHLLEAVHPTQVIAVAALVLLIIEKLTLRQSFVMVWPEGYLLLAFVSASALSTFSAFWPLRAYEASVDLGRILIAYFLIVNTVVTEKRLRAFLVAMVVGGLFPALGTLNSYRHGELLEGRAHWIGVFGNPNELAYILVMLVPLAAVLSGRARITLRILLWAMISIYVAAIYLTFSRGSLMGLFGVIALLALRQRGMLLKVAMGLLLAGGRGVHGYFLDAQ